MGSGRLRRASIFSACAFTGRRASGVLNTLVVGAPQQLLSCMQPPDAQNADLAIHGDFKPEVLLLCEHEGRHGAPPPSSRVSTLILVFVSLAIASV